MLSLQNAIVCTVSGSTVMAQKVGIFVSHHHSESEDAFTARLVRDLEVAGADVWVDDARITSDDFIQKINEGLSGRQWLVLIMTPEALRSPWVQTEVNAALNQVRKGRMRGVIPIMAKPCADEDIPPLLDALHRYDATRNYEPARLGLLRALDLISPEAPAAVPSQTLPFPPSDASPKQDHDARGSTVGLDALEKSELAGPELGSPAPELAAWLRAGKAHLEASRLEQALAAYESALAIDGNSALAWSGKAIVLKQMGRNEEAGFAARCAQIGAVITRRREEGY
jgi:tetratricopeptide (TPR) repeat protein